MFGLRGNDIQSQRAGILEGQSSPGKMPALDRQIGNQIDAAMIFARAEFINVHGFDHSHRRRRFDVLIARFLRTNIG